MNDTVTRSMDWAGWPQKKNFNLHLFGNSAENKELTRFKQCMLPIATYIGHANAVFPL